MSVFIIHPRAESVNCGETGGCVPISSGLTTLEDNGEQLSYNLGHTPTATPHFGLPPELCYNTLRECERPRGQVGGPAGHRADWRILPGAVYARGHCVRACSLIPIALVSVSAHRPDVNVRAHYAKPFGLFLAPEGGFAD